MDNQNLEWLTQGPLALLGSLRKLPKRSERMFKKFDPDSIVKAKYHLDNFYLQL